jgi:histidine triad (HIT) family protein
VSENHTLIIPKKHYVNLYDIPESELEQLIVAAKKITFQLQRDHDVQGVNVIHSSGVEAQQSVFHFHLHIVPRKQGDGLHHFMLPD